MSLLTSTLRALRLPLFCALLWLLSAGKARAPYTVSQGTVLGRRGRVRVTTGDDGSVWVGGATRTLIAGTVQL